MELSMLEPDMLGFLKNFKKDWNVMQTRADRTSKHIESMSTKLDSLDNLYKTL